MSCCPFSSQRLLDILISVVRLVRLVLIQYIRRRRQAHSSVWFWFVPIDILRPNDPYTSELGHRCFSLWLVACLIPSHYLNQCRLSRNNFSNIWSTNIIFKKINLKMSPVKCQPFCLGHNGLRFCRFLQCLKLSQKRFRSSWLESQIINIKLKENQQKIPDPPPKLSASDWWTYGNFHHWIPVIYGLLH